MAGNYGNPNARERLKPENPVDRYFTQKDKYDDGPKLNGKPMPGYECVSRRPHVRGVIDMLPDADADRLEQIMGDMPKRD